MSFSSMKQGTLLLGLALVVLAAGVALQAAAILSGGWPTLLPAFLIAYSLPFLAWGLWARRRSGRIDAPWIAVHASWLGVPLLVCGLVLHQAVTGVSSRSVEPMLWSVVTDSSTRSQRVVLRFRDAPEHFVHVVSEKLAVYLRQSGKSEVSAEFEVIRDYGRVRGFRIVRVDEVTDLRMEAAGHNCTGPCTTSPW